MPKSAGLNFKRVICFGLLISWGCPSKITAQQLSAKNFDPAVSPSAIGATHTSRALDLLQVYSQLSIDYANDPLAGYDSNQTFLRLIQHRLTAELGLAIGLWRRTEFALSMPFSLRQVMQTTNQGPVEATSGLGDLRLMPKINIWGSSVGAGWGGLALVGEVSLPTGTKDRLMADGWSFSPRVVVDYCHPRFLVALNASYRLRRKSHFESVVIDDHIRLDLAAEIPIGRGQFSGAAELSATFGLAPAENAPHAEMASFPVEAHGFLKWRHPRGLFTTVGAGLGLTLGHGAPDARVMASFGFLLGETKPYLILPQVSQPPSLLRGNALAPREEHPSEPSRSQPRFPETTAQGQHPPTTAQGQHPPTTTNDLSSLGITAYPDPPGSMDRKTFDTAIVRDLDRDSDGIPLPGDQCPEQAEDFDHFQDDDGCPDLDNDQDGNPDIMDECPLKPEVINGVDDDDGCPDEGHAKVQVLGQKVTFLGEKIYFKSGSDMLLPRSFSILNQIAGVLKAHWEIRKLTIEGHTDNRGDSEMNVDLSERRARRVRDFLVNQGVALHRVNAKGFGPTAPIVSNKKRKDRAKNRRVEFTITEQISPETTK